MFTSLAGIGAEDRNELTRRAATNHELFTAAADRSRTQTAAGTDAPSAHTVPAYRVALARALVGLAHRLDPV